MLRAQQRPHDVIGRLGGEEFAFVLPGADLEADRERRRAHPRSRSRRWRWSSRGERFRATISLGCAAVVDAQTLQGSSAAELETLIREADAALYEAKRLGRNRVHLAPSPFRQRQPAT